MLSSPNFFNHEVSERSQTDFFLPSTGDAFAKRNGTAMDT